jgi:hypothetical protein
MSLHPGRGPRRGRRHRPGPAPPRPAACRRRRPGRGPRSHAAGPGPAGTDQRGPRPAAPPARTGVSPRPPPGPPAPCRVGPRTAPPGHPPKRPPPATRPDGRGWLPPPPGALATPGPHRPAPAGRAAAAGTSAPAPVRSGAWPRPWTSPAPPQLGDAELRHQRTPHAGDPLLTLGPRDLERRRVMDRLRRMCLRPPTRQPQQLGLGRIRFPTPLPRRRQQLSHRRRVSDLMRRHLLFDHVFDSRPHNRQLRPLLHRARSPSSRTRVRRALAARVEPVRPTTPRAPPARTDTAPAEHRLLSPTTGAARPRHRASGRERRSSG